MTLARGEISPLVRILPEQDIGRLNSSQLSYQHAVSYPRGSWVASDEWVGAHSRLFGLASLPVALTVLHDPLHVKLVGRLKGDVIPLSVFIALTASCFLECDFVCRLP